MVPRSPVRSACLGLSLAIALFPRGEALAGQAPESTSSQGPTREPPSEAVVEPTPAVTVPSSPSARAPSFATLYGGVLPAVGGLARRGPALGFANVPLLPPTLSRLRLGALGAGVGLVGQEGLELFVSSSLFVGSSDSPVDGVRGALGLGVGVHTEGHGGWTFGMKLPLAGLSFDAGASFGQRLGAFYGMQLLTLPVFYVAS